MRRRRVQDIATEWKHRGIGLEVSEVVAELVALGHGVQGPESSLDDAEAAAALRSILKRQARKREVPSPPSSPSPYHVVVRRKAAEPTWQQQKRAAPSGRPAPEQGKGLPAALQECREGARRGHAIATQNLAESSAAISAASRSLAACLTSLKDGKVRTPGVIEQLTNQLSDVVTELQSLQSTAEAELAERRKRLDFFSVALFGRTMAGKSTLMEILTQGDGRSIGRGAQRTTRDVRTYEWNGLSVTDVPGVAAFEGAEDEELAFATASVADLVVFLVTDDAPQPVEAECLARVRRLGKPVLGICNVKAALDDSDDLALFLGSQERLFDAKRLTQLVDQFHAFAEQHGPGRRIQFLPTHLRSRYLANSPDHAAHRERLLAASRFARVEERIVQEVLGKGTFHRGKSFIDGAVVPMMELAELLLQFSAQNSTSGRVLIDKRRQFAEWTERFKAHGQKRVDGLVATSMNSLRDEVPVFVEDHYEDASAGEAWNRLVESAGITRSAKRVQNELGQECKKALLEIARELKSELTLVGGLAADRNIQMSGIFNGKRAWGWATNILAGGLGVAALILGSTPIGWAAAAVGVIGWAISFVFDDREEKATRARAKLTKRINLNIAKMERELGKTLGDWFHKDLLARQVYVLRDDLGAVTSGLFQLADAQRSLAWALCERQKALARLLLNESLAHLGAPQLAAEVIDLARVPGVATMLVIRAKTIFPGHLREGLERLLGEHLWFVIDKGNPFLLLAQALGRECDRSKIRIEEKIRVAHVPLDTLGPLGRVRVQLAQQLTGLHVMK